MRVCCWFGYSFKLLTAARFTVDGLVGPDSDLGASRDGARNDDRERLFRLGSLGQAGEVGHRDGVAGSTAGGSAVLRGITVRSRLCGLAAGDLVAGAQELGRRGRGNSRQQGGHRELHLEKVGKKGNCGKG